MVQYGVARVNMCEEAMVSRCETMDLPEVARVLGISRGVAYRLANGGQLPCLRLGKRMVVPKAALGRLLADPPGLVAADEEAER